VRRILAETGPRPAAVVSHGGPIRAILCHCRGSNMAHFWTRRVPPGSVLELRVPLEAGSALSMKQEVAP